FTPVGAGVGLCGVGTLASPSSWSHESSPLQPGRRKRPHPTPHHSRPYECDDLPPKKLTPHNPSPAPTGTRQVPTIRRFCSRSLFIVRRGARNVRLLGRYSRLRDESGDSRLIGRCAASSRHFLLCQSLLTCRALLRVRRHGAGL